MKSPKILNARQEAFARFIASGDSIPVAYKKAGFNGDPTRRGSCLAKREDVTQRVVAFRDRIAQGVIFKREDLAAYLVQAILTPPNEVDGDSPLVEEVFSDVQPFGRGKENRKRMRVRVKMVSKLQAAKQLAALLGWDQPVKIQVEARSGALQDIEARAALLCSALDRAIVPTRGRVVENKPDLLAPPAPL